MMPKADGHKIKEEREKKGWSQEVLAQKTKICQRTVVNLEKGHNAYLRTFQKIAAELNVEVHDLFSNVEDRITPSLLSYASEKSTTIFSETLDQLLRVLERGSDLVVLAGPPGIGKSRVAAALFESSLSPNLLPVWFTQNSVEDLLRNIGEAQGKYPDRKLCIVLDEDHQYPVRDAAFFIEFFTRAWGVICGLHHVVLVMRSSTYEILTERNFLVRASIIPVSGGKELLDKPRMWGLDRALSSDERSWILEIGLDKDGNLITLLVDRICIPYLVSGQKIGKGQFGDRKSILETVYQGLVASQPKNKRQLLEALCVAGQFATFIPLILITAVLRTMGREAKMEEVEEELDYLEYDGLVTFQEIRFGCPTYSWRLFHDLVNECLTLRYRRHRFRQINRESILDSTVSLVRSEASDDLFAFTEGLVAWAACVTGEGKFGKPLADALFEASEVLKKNVDLKKDIYASICWTVIGLSFLPTQAISDPSVFESICALGDILARTASLDILLNEGLISGFAYQAVRCGVACGILPKHAAWEIPASAIPCLSQIGQRWTADTAAKQIFEQYHSLSVRNRFIHLLMCAGKWDEAGQAIEAAISDLDHRPSEDLQYELAQINTAACAYLEAGNLQTACNVYRWGADLSGSVSGMKHIADIFSTNAQILSDRSNEPTKWSELMNEWRTRIEAYQKDAPPPTVAIIGNFPDHGAGSLIADNLETRGVNCQLIYSEVVQDLSDSLPSKGFIIIGGYMAYSIERLLRPVICQEDYAKMILKTAEATGRGILEFDVSGRPGIWIGGGNIRGTISAIQHWLESDGFQRFMDRLQAATSEGSNR